MKTGELLIESRPSVCAQHIPYDGTFLLVVCFFLSFFFFCRESANAKANNECEGDSLLVAQLAGPCESNHSTTVSHHHTKQTNPNHTKTEPQKKMFVVRN